MIIVQDLKKGEIVNVAAILMGQLAKNNQYIFSKYGIIDKSGFVHSGIKNNVIILKSTYEELFSFCNNLLKEDVVEKYNTIVFTEEGRLLNNSYEEYEKLVKTNALIDLSVIGVAVAGEDDEIRELTKQFKLY